jgi:hypothetical protein
MSLVEVIAALESSYHLLLLVLSHIVLAYVDFIKVLRSMGFFL